MQAQRTAHQIVAAVAEKRVQHGHPSPLMDLMNRPVTEFDGRGIERSEIVVLEDKKAVFEARRMEMVRKILRVLPFGEIKEYKDHGLVWTGNGDVLYNTNDRTLPGLNIYEIADKHGLWGPGMGEWRDLARKHGYVMLAVCGTCGNPNCYLSRWVKFED